MRQTYIVSYDVSSPKRLRKVYRALLGYGEHVQLSVFRCELTRRELVELRVKLGGLIHHDQDQVLFVDVGPVAGRGGDAIAAIGKPYVAPERLAIVV